MHQDINYKKQFLIKRESFFKIKVKHNVNSVLEGCKSYYSTLAENLVKLLPKLPNKYSIGTVFKYYQHIIQGDHFNLASVSKSSILTILKVNKVLNAAGQGNLSGRFLKDGTEFLTKPIDDLCNLPITSEKFPTLAK